MIAAAGIESSAAAGTFVTARHVLRDAELATTRAAKHGRQAPLFSRPDLNWMACQGVMAILAGIIDAAAFHLNRNDVESGSVVSAARLIVTSDPVSFWAR